MWSFFLVYRCIHLLLSCLNLLHPSICDPSTYEHEETVNIVTFPGNYWGVKVCWRWKNWTRMKAQTGCRSEKIFYPKVTAGGRHVGVPQWSLLHVMVVTDNSSGWTGERGSSEWDLSSGFGFKTWEFFWENLQIFKGMSTWREVYTG